MSSVYTNGPARRLLCSAFRKTESPVVIATGRPGYSPICDAQGKRKYATKRLNPNARTANSPSTRAKASPSSPPPSRAPGIPAKDNRYSSNSEPARLLFSTQDIPPLQEWVSSLEGLGNKHLTPLECVDGARRYVSVATQYESQWRPKLEPGRRL